MQRGIEHGYFLHQKDEPLCKLFILFGINFRFIFEGFWADFKNVVKFIISCFDFCESLNNFWVKFVGKFFRKCLIDVQHINTNIVSNFRKLKLFMKQFLICCLLHFEGIIVLVLILIETSQKGFRDDLFLFL